MLDYAIADLTTIAQCDEILEIVDLDKAEQDYKRRQLDKKHAVAIKDGPSIEIDIQTATDNIAFLEGAIVGMPEGEAKKDRESELSKAKLDLKTLLRTLENYGVLSKLKYEYLYNALEKSLAEIEVFITAVLAKKATL
jgi:hypothetical protein